jgi:hypothetical protein
LDSGQGPTQESGTAIAGRLCIVCARLKRYGPISTADSSDHEHRPGNRNRPRRLGRHPSRQTTRLDNLRCFLAGYGDHRWIDDQEHARTKTLATDSRQAFGPNIDAPCGHSEAPTLAPPPSGWGFLLPIGLLWGLVVLTSQFRTGTPTSTGLRPGKSMRATSDAGRDDWAISHVHQRRRKATDSSPSSRAAFSRADMASLASARASIMIVSQRSRSRSKLLRAQ